MLLPVLQHGFLRSEENVGGHVGKQVKACLLPKYLSVFLRKFIFKNINKQNGKHPLYKV